MTDDDVAEIVQLAATMSEAMALNATALAAGPIALYRAMVDGGLPPDVAATLIADGAIRLSK